MMATVSVVVPLFNKARYLRRALDSIASQRFTDLEAIVVDDGSTDEGAQIAAEYTDPRFRLIAQPNSGPGSARNRGILDARGEFVAFLDADDAWLPDYLDEGIRLLRAYRGSVVAVTSGYIEHPAGVSREPMWRGRGITDGPQRVCRQTPPELVVAMLAYMSPCSTLVRADIVRRLGGFYSRDQCLYGEDAFLWLKVLLNETVALTLRPLARIHREASSLSTNRHGVRPVEPFLTHPDEIEEYCPADLRDLLARVLAIRAFKTACVLGYWGHWREARALINRFAVPGDWRLPRYFAAQLCGTRFGAGLGTAWRTVLARRIQFSVNDEALGL